MIQRALVVLLFAAAPAAASAQVVFEVTGARALGMGGAFVAVADDPSAAHWNPSGLLFGPPAGMTIEWDRFQIGNPDDPAAPGAGRRAARIGSVGSWPLGLSYGRFRTTSIVSREAGAPEVRTLSTSYYGATVLQTLVEGLVLGSTLKYVRGGAISSPIEAETAGEAIDRVEAMDERRRGTFDLDIGLMADLGKVRVGWTLKNLRQPAFALSDETAMRLPRRSRIGLAVLPVDGLTLAMDVDLDTADRSDGLRRMIALGGETRLGQRAAVRTGVRWAREGPRELEPTAGVSVAVRPGYWLDGFYSHRRGGTDRGFGVALRAGGM